MLESVFAYLLNCSCYGGLLILCTLVVDLLYGFIDPRVKLEE